MRRETDKTEHADLAAVAASLKALSTSVDKLNTELPGLAAAQTRKKLFWPALCFFVLLVAVLVGTWEGHQSRIRLIDCTEPQGQCYQEAQVRGQASTGKAIEQLVTKIIAEFEVSLNRAVKQNNCDQGFGCDPGFTPNPTTTTSKGG